VQHCAKKKQEFAPLHQNMLGHCSLVEPLRSMLVWQYLEFQAFCERLPFEASIFLMWQNVGFLKQI
jgi:hypothetical protein